MFFFGSPQIEQQQHKAPENGTAISEICLPMCFFCLPFWTNSGTKFSTGPSLRAVTLQGTNIFLPKWHFESMIFRTSLSVGYVI